LFRKFLSKYEKKYLKGIYFHNIPIFFQNHLPNFEKLGGMDCILGMEFITQNNVLIKGHNRLVRIPSKSGIVKVKADELPCVGGPTIHFMVGKAWEKECVGGFGMMCVMRVLDEHNHDGIKPF